MNKNDLIKMARNPNFISGIYNYCDRWCERCPFTSRCLQYAMEQEEQIDPEARDITNEAFWENLHAIFQQTLELIQEFAEEQGIDLESLDLKESEQEEARQRKWAESHKLSRAAMHYSKMVEDWLKSEKPLFREKEAELNEKISWGLDASQQNAEAASIVDAVEIIRWYQHQIYVKMMRGLMGAKEDRMEADDFPKDSDGSVKVALIGIDRSITAWGILREHFPEKTDDLLTILLHLDRLRRAAEKEFPNARAFVRPGFDTIPS
jgi:hypothetical protein